jgi:TonB family protein
MQRRITVGWPRDQPERGDVTVVFEVQKDGSFSAPVIEKSGGVVLDAATMRAFRDLRLQALPKEYTQEHLKIHLTFPYGR